MKKPWFRIKHGIHASDLVTKLGDKVLGGDRLRALGVWVMWLDHVNTQAPETGKVSVGGLDCFTRMARSWGLSKGCGAKFALFLEEYRDEEGRPVCHYDREAGVLQMARWSNWNGRSASAKAVSRCRQRKKERPKELACNISPLSLSLSSSSSQSEEQKPNANSEIVRAMLADSIPEASASAVSSAAGLWVEARREKHGDLAGASVLAYRREICLNATKYGPGFVEWTFTRAAKNGWKDLHWDVSKWREDAGKGTERPKTGAVY